MPSPSPSPHLLPAGLLLAGLLAACGEAPAVEQPSPAPGDGGDPAAASAAPLQEDGQQDGPGAAAAGPAPAAPPAEPHPLDPDGWQPVTVWEGEAVDTVRVTFDDGRLQRIACYLAGSRRQEDQHGPEWVFFPNGVPRSQTMWVHGVLQGPFAERFPTGMLRREGRYLDGQRHGTYRQYFRSSDLNLEYEYDRGRPHGVWREFFVGQAPAKEEHFQGGQLHGVRRLWGRPGGLAALDPTAPVSAGADDGHVLLEESWVEGELHGPWRSFWPSNGEPQFLRHYERGVQQGLEVSWGEDGGTLSETTFVDGRAEGPQRLYHPGGELLAEGTLRDGQRVGHWTYYTPEGAIDEAWTGTYQDDERVGDEPPPR